MAPVVWKVVTNVSKYAAGSIVNDSLGTRNECVLCVIRARMERVVCGAFDMCGQRDGFCPVQAGRSRVRVPMRLFNFFQFD
jgi:hypothetical protein